ncbi:P27 family phage terminase small subunit [Agrobacterium tumefaciens]|uniref:P27 family phage terminase small subunit n=1 Tax=Agrobacterium tumefaciens TaxID=358 RepID=UPI00157280DF|nr:P27 family phage terminase small subunit [Agrobacterium tumefaciens]
MSIHNRGVKPAIQRDSTAITKMPAPPKRLSPHAKAEWRRVFPVLIKRGVVTSGDLAGIESYCTAVGFVAQITEQMAGMAVPDMKLGGLQIRYMQTARQLAAEYGLMPASRSRIGGAGPADDDDDNPLAVV